MTRADSFARAKKLPRVKFYVDTGEKAKKPKSKTKTIKDRFDVYDMAVANEVRTRITLLMDNITKDYKERISLAEGRASKAEVGLSYLKEKLTSFLTPDQIAAAEICGCSPEVYAIEFIELWKERMWPKFGTTSHPFSALPVGSMVLTPYQSPRNFPVSGSIG